ncbi:cache domain-containing protein [uncultured Desulfovibrio sp.]|uniref:cache domain-containing protein n=1 Tax=uncultured Desulfovibrio sp. TaxID=167968 RepID=UPI00220F8856|nr:cache domain-containing protein [uncultured Desulfovibrio sp.]CAI3234376.1 hypothetical protein DWUX_1434 [Desulfovibrio diazotrophicus]
MSDAGTRTQTSLKTLLPLMPEIRRCQDVFAQLERKWTWIALTGKINCNAIAATLFDFIFKTRDTFAALRQNLSAMLAEKSLDRAIREMAPVAQVAIDIIKRNLYERTADVSFLATDADIVHFLCHPRPDAAAMRERLAAYRANYTVYQDILILDPNGNVRVQLDTRRPVRRSCDPLIAQALASHEYVEAFGQTDLVLDGRAALVYAHAIRAEGESAPLGVLCLVFDMDGEVADLFAGLSRFADDMVILLLDDQGTAFAGSDKALAPLGRRYRPSPQDGYAVTRFGNETGLAVTRSSAGYQGYTGQHWQAHVLRGAYSAFARRRAETGLDTALVRREAEFSSQLISIEEQAGDVLGDLTLAAQNGQIMAARQSSNAKEEERGAAQALPPILDAVRQMGGQMEREFHYFTDGLLNTVTASRLRDAAFLASITVEIMDRNLYERANDCRWWALTRDFRAALAKPALDPQDLRQLEGILAYINSYYTVYANLFLYNAQGNILACSQEAERFRYGSQVAEDYARRTLSLDHPEDYAVSAFRPTDLYHPAGEPQPTYIYSAPVFPLQGGRPVGGIGIVFDALPQFGGMLQETLPKDAQGVVRKGAAGLFVDAGGTVIASSLPDLPPGATYRLHKEWLTLDEGESRSYLESQAGVLYAMGCARSRGYREYKRDNRYRNDMYCVMRLPI